MNKSEPRFHQALISAFSQRQLGDYTVHSGLRIEDIEKLQTSAEDFIEATRAWLSKNG